MSHPLHGPAHHFGYAVSDLDAAIGQFVRHFGAGPFFRIDHVPLAGITSQGEPGEYDHSSAFGACGSTMFELMQVHRTAPRRAQEAFALAAPALHHVGYVVTSLDEGVAALAADGIPEALRANLGDIGFVYLDARPILGHNVELLADVPAFHDFFAMIRGAADGWDGTEPVRTPSFS